MMDKIELHEKFRNKALDFLLNQARQKNLPQELKPLIDIANQVKNSKGMSIEYPLQLKTEENQYLDRVIGIHYSQSRLL